MPKVIVVGGGIAGLTSAVALQQLGWDVEIHEAADGFRPVGKGIWVPTNAMQELEQIGLASPVSAAGWPLERIQIRTRWGKTLSTIDLKRVEREYGHTTIAIRREDLIRNLASALPSDSFHFDRRFVGFQNSTDQVVARFADGSNALGDLLIGADGIHSAVREQLIPGVRLRYTGQTCCRGISTFELPADLSKTCWEVWGGSERFGFSSLGSNLVYWFAPMTRLPSQTGLTSVVLPKLQEMYSHFPEPIPELLAHSSASEVITTDLYDFLPISKWYAGRTVLIGDAAHAMTPNLGQGGAQAIEDGIALAREIGRHQTLNNALAAFEKQRMPRTKWISRLAWRLGQVAHWTNPVATLARDFALQLTPTYVNRMQLGRLFAFDDS
ncbi:MAG: FAD-dependent monooxygenase [Planctomycetota bacterium]|nr:FAD-dependent monooxygenase [Planctomycetota bacterium]